MIEMVEEGEIEKNPVLYVYRTGFSMFILWKSDGCIITGYAGIYYIHFELLAVIAL